MNFLKVPFFLILLFASMKATAQEDCCSDILKFGRKTVIKTKSDLAILFNEKVGLSQHYSDAGGSLAVFKPFEVKSDFQKKVHDAKFSHAKAYSLKKLDTYVYRNELTPQIAAMWLECMKARHNGAAMSIDGKGKMVLRLVYGDERWKELEIIDVKMSKGISLVGNLKKKFNGEQKVGIKRRAGTNNMEGILVKCRSPIGKEFTLEAYMPPVIPPIVHWTEEISVSVPSERSKNFKFTIPPIPSGFQSEFVAVYQGGTPADCARINLVAAAHVFEEKSGREIGSVNWQQGAPNTHIRPSKQSFKLKSDGRFRVDGTSIVERNRDWRGGSLLKLMVILKLKPDCFEVKW